MKHLKKVLIGLAAMLTFGVVTGVTPIARELVGAETSEAANLPGLSASYYSYKKDKGRYKRDVKIIQQRYNKWARSYNAYNQKYHPSIGKYRIISEDGYFGWGTHLAIVEYQIAAHIYHDGSVGPVTWYTLSH